jgi:hypothetical protein
VLAPNQKKLDTKTVKKLLECKYVHIDSCLRQPQSSTTDSQTVAQVGSLTISSSSTSRARTVNDPLTWFEAFNSSVMPAQVRIALTAATFEEAKSRLQHIERLVNYQLAATTYFRQYSFTSAKNYLESHRDECMSLASPRNIAEPNTLSLSRMTPLTTSHSSSSSSSSSTKSHDNKVGKKYEKGKSDNCGSFNSFKGCSYTDCKFAHICKTCKATDHGQTSCAQWKAKNPKRK